MLLQSNYRIVAPHERLVTSATATTWQTSETVLLNSAMTFERILQGGQTPL